MRLLLFGASQTEGYNLKYKWAKDYLNYKGYLPKWWDKRLAEKLNCEFINYGLGGTDNYTIFQFFCDRLNLIKENDVILIGWTSTLRFRICNKKNGKFDTILIQLVDDYDFENISKQTLEEISLNRFQ